MQPGTAQPKTDRRAYPRQKIQSLTYVELGGGNGGIALNVSEGGMTVVAAQPLDADGAIDIALQLPQTRKRLALKAEIRWMSDSHKEAGIRFLEMTDEQLDDIRGWMSREGSPQPMEDIAAIPSLRESYRRDIPAAAFEDDGDELLEEDVAPISEPEPQPQLSAPPRKIERVFEAGHQEQDLRAASDQLHGRESSAVLKEPQVDDVPPPPVVEPRTVPSAVPRASRAARTPFTTLASDSPAAPPANTLAREEIVERVVETVAALNSATSAARTPPSAASLGLGFAGPHLPENPRPTLGASYRAAETVDDGSKDFRIHLQSGWVLALLVLLLALISFVAGMAVRRGALNRVLGEGEAAAGAHGGAAPSATPQSGAAIPPQNAAATLRQIEIIDAANRRWEISAAPGGAVTQAPIPNADATAAGAAPLSSAAANNGTPASNSSTTQSGADADLEDATTTNTADGGLLLSLPETPVAASSLVAISARRFIPVPADAASKTRNLQVGSLANLVEPVYPVDALQQNVEGTVKLRGTISADGSMKSLDVENGPKLLMTPSLTALRLWRYNPTMLNGKAIETEEEITLVYRLPR
jgi:hypothetical protein